MSALAELIESELSLLVRRWTGQVQDQLSFEAHAGPDVHGQVQGVLRELVFCLRRGAVPEPGLRASEHSFQRHRMGCRLEALVRAYDLLRGVIMDLMEERLLPVTLSEVRVLSDFFSTAIREGVSEHHPRSEALVARLAENEGQEGAPARPLGTMTDITGLKQAADERERLLGEVEAARNRLLSVFENAPAFLALLKGPEHVMEVVNTPYQRLVGTGRKLVGLSVAEALPEVVPQGFVALLDGVYRTGTPYIGNETFARFDRQGRGELEEVCVNFVYQPLRDARGQVDGIFVFGFDITEQVQSRQRAETLARKVQASETQLRQVTDAIPVLVSLVTAEERYGFANKAYEDWFGHPRETLIGRPVREVIGEAAYAVLGPYVQRGLAGESFSFEQHGVPYRFGGTRDVKVTFNPYRDMNGQPDGYVALLQDITVQRRMEAALKRQAEFEQHLIGIVSHDLRSPLGAIHLGATAMARREDLDERSRKSVMRIQNAAERAIRMVKDLLDFTQARLGGGIRIERRPTNLHELARGVVDEVEAAYPARELRVRRSGDGRGSWDPDRLSQVVQNLVTNALKYSPDDTPIQVETFGVDGEVTLSVHNQGAPIPPELLASLFQPLTRGTAEIDTAGRSVGLGLYIVQSIVEAHGGRVEVQSTAEVGTTFTVRLSR
ncbi:sensor histidine kinase [Stigmatella aurantiaca]|uniref:histidine kinase n=1 Tax=Stigmatella aurantiaca (strain DW4/3-1) TaxID=378806 RepID=Q08R05_STIAD|nr:PAS domain-containing protein [Stigmatella aurantiaca]ADO70553.1 Sensor protein [Stigmatella aurantiaca DW4/3-1]EAU62915.1 histidine protein kinase AsgD [Stigmatella aurantiaca DW4/3-1]